MLLPVADRFVAGETAAEALDRARRLNDEGIGAIINLLGEHHRDPDDVARDAATYRRLAADIGASDLRASVSVKPTQLGLAVDEATFRETLRGVADAAAAADVFLWLDMEGASTTTATLAAFRTVAGEAGDSNGGVGVCLQANLRRTPADIRSLADAGGTVRLVKGAYDEDAAVAYRSRAAVDRAYEACLEVACQSMDRVAVGSHDPRMVELALELGDTHDTAIEVQMLMGVRESRQRELAADHEVHQYVPYGPAWARYFLRRVGERRENLQFALRALLGER